MGLFSKTKNKKAYTWKVYQDVLGDKKLSVRVDTKYKGKNYKNTFYIQLKYSEQETVELPDKEFLNKLTNLEEKAIHMVNL